MIPRKNTSRPTRGSDNILLLDTKHNLFQKTYFAATIKEWNRLDIDIWKSENISIFKKRILSFSRSLPSTVSSTHNLQGLLTIFRLGLSHLRFHKFKHNFLYTINPLSSCGSNIETTFHFFLYYPNVIECTNTLWAKSLKLIVIW